MKGGGSIPLLRVLVVLIAEHTPQGERVGNIFIQLIMSQFIFTSYACKFRAIYREKQRRYRF